MLKTFLPRWQVKCTVQNNRFSESYWVLECELMGINCYHIWVFGFQSTYYYIEVNAFKDISREYLWFVHQKNSKWLSQTPNQGLGSQDSCSFPLHQACVKLPKTYFKQDVQFGKRRIITLCPDYFHQSLFLNLPQSREFSLQIIVI